MASLFNSTRFNDLVNNKIASMQMSISKLEQDDFEGSTIDEIAEKLSERFKLETPQLKEGEISQKTPEDVSIKLKGRGYSGGSAKVDGTKYIVVIPFEGDSDMLEIRPSTVSTLLPKGLVGSDGIRMIYEVPVGEDALAAIKADIDRNLILIKKYLGFLSKDVVEFNMNLLPALKTILERRKNKLDNDNEIASGLGFPIK